MIFEDLIYEGFEVIEQGGAGRALAIVREASVLDDDGRPVIEWIDGDSVVEAVSRIRVVDGSAHVLMMHVQREVSAPTDLQVSESEHGRQSRWVFATSGTTGTAKLVAHTLASLTRTTVRRSAPEQVWGMLYPWYRFAGMQVLLQAAASGAALVVPDLSGGISVQLAFLVDNGCTHLSATPTMWRKILMSGLSTRMELKQITLGGEIADQKTLDALTQAFPDARITHIFASTEAGVGFSVNDGREGFPVTYLADPPQGIEMQVDRGRLQIRNPLVGSKYVASDRSVSRDGWVDTGDRVEIRDGRVFFLGRDSGLINVGGSKFFPEQVEAVAVGVDGVALARVATRKSSIVGELVILEVTSDGSRGREELIDAARERCVAYLPEYMRPAKIRIVEYIAVNESGKVCR